MSESSRIPVLIMLLFVITVQLLALAITPAISASDYRVFADPTSTTNPVVYMLLILAFTALLLLAIKKKKSWIVSGFIQISIASSIYYLMAAFMPPLLALLPTAAVLLLLRYYPEWYVIDAFGIVVCAGISSLFGVSMAILPTLLLLIILAVYDALSVYKTRHMVSLAEGVIKIKAPLLFVVPRSRGYSFRKDPAPVSTPASGDASGNQANGNQANPTSGSQANPTSTSQPSNQVEADKNNGERQEGRVFPGPGGCHHTHHSGHIGLHHASCRRLFGRKFSGNRSHAGHLSWLPGSNDHLPGSAPGGTALPQFRSDFWIPGGLRSGGNTAVLNGQKDLPLD